MYEAQAGGVREAGRQLAQQRRGEVESKVRVSLQCGVVCQGVVRQLRLQRLVLRPNEESAFSFENFNILIIIIIINNYLIIIINV